MTWGDVARVYRSWGDVARVYRSWGDLMDRRVLSPRGRVPEETLRKAAKLHRDAPYGLKVEIVARGLHVSDRTARRYIKEARDLGLD